jgi:hypothetical protein
MENDKLNEEELETSYSNIDWDNRILCEDGNCIGVIGPDGKCKECGKKYEGALPETSDAAEHPLSDGPGETDETDAPEQSAADEPAVENEDPNDWSNRQLCSDGNCIGVIGSDGRCKECGKPLE